MFGWDPRPSIEQVVAWVAYIVPVTWFFLAGPSRRSTTAEPTTAESTGDRVTARV
jgi:hypothetical protein